MNHETGKSRKLNDEDMATMQTLASDILLMERDRQKLSQVKSIWNEMISSLRSRKPNCNV